MTSTGIVVHRRWDSQPLSELRAWLAKQLDGHAPLPLSADDLIEEVILRYMVACEARSIESPFAYARTILLNVIRDRLRELERGRRVLEEVSRRPRCEDAGDGLQVENGDLVAYLLGHSSLSPPQKKVLEMVYFNRMTIAEIARELCRNPGTIQQHHDRGIEKLARCAATLGVHQ